TPGGAIRGVATCRRSPTRPATPPRCSPPRNHTPCPRSGGRARWRQDGAYTTASSVLNVGSFAAPSALGAAVGLSRLARLAHLADTTTDAIHAGRVFDRNRLIWRDPGPPPPPPPRRTP